MITDWTGACLYEPLLLPVNVSRDPAQGSREMTGPEGGSPFHIQHRLLCTVGEGGEGSPNRWLILEVFSRDPDPQMQL
jgi:hypothetical protein